MELVVLDCVSDILDEVGVVEVVSLRLAIEEAEITVLELATEERCDVVVVETAWVEEVVALEVDGRWVRELSF